MLSRRRAKGGVRKHEGRREDFTSFMKLFSDIFINDRYYQNFGMVNDLAFSNTIGNGAQFSARLMRLPPHASVRTSHEASSRLTEGSEIVLKWMIMTSDENLKTDRLNAIINDFQIISRPGLREHPRILDVYGFAWDQVDGIPDVRVLPVIMVEYGNMGTIGDYLCSPDMVDLDTKLLLASDIAHGLDAMHRLRIVHSDVKPDNILVCQTAGERPIAKLSDFGNALILDERPSPSHWRKGTTIWMAPEHYSELSNDEVLRTDAYSCGLILWTILLNGAMPWDLARFDGTDPTSSFQRLKARPLDFVEAAIDSVTATGAVPEDRIGEVAELLKTLLGPAESRSLQLLVDYQTSLPRLEISNEARTTALEAFDGNRPVFKDFGELYDLPLLVQRQILRSLQTIGRDVARYQPEEKAEAYFAAAVLSLLRIGTVHPSTGSSAVYTGYDVDVNDVLSLLTKAAHLGSPSAQACYYNVSKALSAQSAVAESVPRNSTKFCPDAQSVSHETIIKWLHRATMLGSHIASCTLRELDIETWSNAIRDFRTSYCGVGIPLFGNNMEERLRQNILLQLDYTAATTVGDQGDTALHVAATLGDVDLVRRLIDGVSHRDINPQNARGETPLLQAARSGHRETVQLLLSVGADASILNIDGENPLHWLCAFSDHEDLHGLASVLIAHGADVDQVCQPNSIFNVHFRNSVGCGTPLSRAVQRYAYTAADALVRLGADPCAPRAEQEEDGTLPHAAALAASAHLAAFLRLFLDSESGIRPPKWYDRAGIVDPEHAFELISARWKNAKTFQSAAPNAWRSMTERGISRSLLGYAVSPDPLHERMSLHGSEYIQAMKETIDAVAALSTQEFDRVTFDHQSALMRSVLSHDVSIVSYLLSTYPDQTRPALTNPIPCGLGMRLPVQLAIAKGERPIFDLLLQHATPDTRVGRMTIRRVTDGWLAQLHPRRSRVSSKARFTSRPRPTDPHFMRALLQGIPPADAQTLINSHGAAADDLPLAMAVLGHHFEVADVLLQYGAEIDEEAFNVSRRRGGGRTTLGAILSFHGSGTARSLDWLLQHGSSSVVNRAGNVTVLHATVLAGAAYEMSNSSSPLPTRLYKLDLTLLKLLVRDVRTRGLINESMVSPRGLTALHIAVLRLWPEAVQLLLGSGVSPDMGASIFGTPEKMLTARELAQGLDESWIPEVVRDRGAVEVSKYLRKMEEVRLIFDGLLPNQSGG